MHIQSLRGPALSEAIRDYIKNYIIANNLRPGDPLPTEPQVMETLGVGRSSVREAVKGLEALGLVEIKRGNGLFVRETNLDPITETLSYNMRFDPKVLSEVFQIRVWLETAIIAEVIAYIDQETLDQLDALLTAWSDKADSGGVLQEYDKAFHKLLYRCLANDTLENFLEAFWVTLYAMSPELKSVGRDEAQRIVAAHRAIFDAVKAGDETVARQRLVEHFASSVVRPLASLEPG